ncbi:MAG: NDP-sugar synthase, partial [Dehalococcoidia bacterium]
SGGAIAGIAAGWDETFVVVNGDVITDLDVTAMVEHHRARQAVLSISLHEVEDPSPFGVVDLADDGRIRRFVEKPPRAEAPSRLINAGTWIFEPHLVGMLDAHAFNRVEDTLFPTLCAQGEAVFGFHRPAYWSDVGTPEALRRVNLDMARGLVASPATPPVTGGMYIDPTATIEDGAHIEAPAVIGAGSRVAAGARVCASVLWAGVHIEEGAIIEDSVLASGVHVGAGATVRASVVAHGAIVEAGASLDGVSVEPPDVASIAEEARLG